MWRGVLLNLHTPLPIVLKARSNDPGFLFWDFRFHFAKKTETLVAAGERLLQLRKKAHGKSS